MRITWRLSAAAACMVSVGILQIPGSSAATPHPALRNSSSTTSMAGSALTLDRGSVSFRGLSVSPGGSSAAQSVAVTNTGDSPAPGLSANASGDFAVVANTCTTRVDAKSRCTVSVVFRPQFSGERTGTLTLSAPGVATQLVNLIAGTPIVFSSVPRGATSVQWVELPSGTGAISGSVSGSFAMALRSSYANDNDIEGVSFGATSASTGTCAADVALPCRVWLGVQQLPTAPIGQSAGIVTLSTGSTYTLTGNVQGPALTVAPVSVDLGSVLVSSSSGLVPISVTNLSSAAITVKTPTVSSPFAARSCGTSIAAGATCIIQVSYESSATGPASGLLQVQTSAGNVSVTLSATGVANPPDITSSPGSGSFVVQYDGTPDSLKSHSQEFTIKNVSTTDSVVLQDFSFNFCGFQGCLVLVSNSCHGTLAPSASCQFKAYDWLSSLPPGSATYAGSSIQIDYTVGGAVGFFDVPYSVSYTSAPATGQLAISPAALVFPPTSYGSVSAAQTLTVTNVSATIYQVTVGSAGDFIADPSCGIVLPGSSCSVAVRYVPTSGNPIVSANLTISATDLNRDYSAMISAGVAVSGTSVPTTTLANPGYPPLVTIDNNGVTVKNTGSVPLFIDNVLSSSGISTSGCASVAPGGECFLEPFFAFQAGSNCPGDVCSVTLYSNSSSSPDRFSIPTADIGYQEAFLFAGPALNVFPVTAVNATSPATVVTVSAAAQDYGISTALNVTSTLVSDFTVNNGCGNTLSINSGNPPIASCNIAVSFTPHSAGFKVGTLQYRSDWGMGTLVFAGNALATAQSVVVSPGAVLIPAALGTSATQAVIIKNTGSTTVALRPAALAGSQSAQFSLGATTCGSSLAAAASCSVNVSYAASTKLGAYASLIIFSGVGTAQIVSLQGVTPALVTGAVTWTGATNYSNGPAFLPFGVTATAQIVFSSTSPTTAQTIKNVALAGSFGANYTITRNTCSVGLVITMNTCEVDLSLSPKVVGLLTESLEVTTDFGVNENDVSVAVELAAPQVSVPSISFGYASVGTSSAPVTVTVTNINPAGEYVDPQLLGGYSGPNPGDFTFQNISCPVPPARLAAQASCAISLRFVPTAAAARSANLQVYSEGQLPTLIALNGTGYVSSTPSVKPTYNAYAIGNNGSHTPTGGIDGYGNAYSNVLLPGSLVIGGVSFNFGAAKQLDALRSTTVNLPAGEFASVALLATGLNGNQANQGFVIHYSDGSSSTVLRSLSDWRTPQHYSGETVASSMAYRLDVNGNPHAGPYSLFEYSLPLTAGKTASSLTLPANANVVVLALSMVPAALPTVAVALDSSANVAGIYRDGDANTGGLDGFGNVYSSVKLGASVTYGGVSFTLLPADAPDAVANLAVSLPPTQFSTLRFIGTAVNGNQQSQSIVITYADGSTTIVQQGFSDWHTPQHYPGETEVSDTSYRLIRNGQKQAGHYLLYGYSVPLDPTKVLKSVTLPKTRKVVVFGMSLSP